MSLVNLWLSPRKFVNKQAKRLIIKFTTHYSFTNQRETKTQESVRNCLNNLLQRNKNSIYM